MLTSKAAIQARLAAFPLKDRYSCDEVGLVYRGAPGESSELDSARVNVLLCANADGSHKLDPLIIGRHLVPRAFKAAAVDVERFGCTYKASLRARMTGLIFEEWLLAFDRQMEGRQVVLLMDDHPAHAQAASLLVKPAWFVRYDRLRNTTILMPPETAVFSQVTKVFKAHYERAWLGYMLAEDKAERDATRTVNILKAVRWVLRAWNAMDAGLISRCWDGLEPQELPAEMTKQLKSQLEQLRRRQVIRRVVPIGRLLAIEPSEEWENLSYEEQIETAPEGVDDDECVEVASKYTPAQAVQMLHSLRTAEEQRHDCCAARLKTIEALIDSWQAVPRQTTMDSWLQS